MRRILLIIALACTLTACGEGSDEAALRTTTTEATFSTSPNPVDPGVGFSNPDEAVEALRAAWETADAPAANVAATSEVVDRLFAVPFGTVQEKGLQFEGCDAGTPAASSSICRYHYEGGSLRFTTTKANGGWRTTGMEQLVN